MLPSYGSPDAYPECQQTPSGLAVAGRFSTVCGSDSWQQPRQSSYLGPSGPESEYWPEAWPMASAISSQHALGSISAVPPGFSPHSSAEYHNSSESPSQYYDWTPRNDPSYSDSPSTSWSTVSPPTAQDVLESSWLSQQPALYPSLSSPLPPPQGAVEPGRDPPMTDARSHAAPDLFDSLNRTRSNPPLPHAEEGAKLRTRSPRFDGDLYTSTWVRGEGTQRAGWCGYCSSWRTLKDSAYWYHMHYAHGISCATGQPLAGPLQVRPTPASNDWDALCGGCLSWVTVAPGERGRTAYFRHAYKCRAKSSTSQERWVSYAKSQSPGKS